MKYYIVSEIQICFSTGVLELSLEFTVVILWIEKIRLIVKNVD